ncbi:MAG: 50S ribosomal protein L21 [Actinomycetota bacterium]
MYAIIKTGGKQYKVTPGDVIEVEHLKLQGDTTSFTPLLVVTDKGETVLGAKLLKDHPVAIKVVGDTKGDKVTVFKYRPKSGYASKTGHRQQYSLIEVVSIGSSKAPKSDTTAARPEDEQSGPQKPKPKVEKQEPADNEPEVASAYAAQPAAAPVGDPKPAPAGDPKPAPAGSPESNPAATSEVI